MDDQRRIVMIETKLVDTASTDPAPINTPRWRYQLTNHLDSVAIELDENSGVLSYEEYHPYGSTAFHTARGGAEVSAKRYRYTGKERDDETGLYYHGARYYAAWLGRWTAADPLGLVDGLNLYRYSRDNPINFSDPGGTQTKDDGFFSGVGKAFSDFHQGLKETGEGFGDFVYGVVHDDNEKIISGGEKVIGFLEGYTIEGQVKGVADAAVGTVTRTAEAVEKAAEGDLEGAGEAATKALGNAAVVGLTVAGLKGPKGAGGVKGAAGRFEAVPAPKRPLPEPVAPRGKTYQAPEAPSVPAEASGVVEAVPKRAGAATAESVENLPKPDPVVPEAAPKSGGSESAPEVAVNAPKPLRRPYIRDAVRKEVEARAPRDLLGRPLDPNTGLPIEGKPDLGHKPGHEFWREKAKAEAEGLTQKQFNDRMNNPDLYQLENPKTNRSHRYEKKR
jgi:RHS repeat-associated protein